MAFTTLTGLLGWSVVLLLAQVVAQAVSVTAAVGLPAAMTPRDGGNTPPTLVSGRLTRALANLLETYPAFIALALGLIVTNKASGLAVTGAQLWLVARVAYVPIYAAGIPGIRTGVWILSIVGLVMMLYAFA
ncbi:MAG TPA: MAPEG family protein [Bosea sp. (in: a-proteobacteria)]